MASIVALCLVGFSDQAQAQVLLPKVGQRFLTLGLGLHPTMVWNREPPADGFGLSGPSWGGGALARLGLQQFLTARALVGLEVDLGALYLGEHQVALQPEITTQDVGFAWQAGLLGRYLPSGDGSGLSLGAGMTYFGAQLDTGSLQVLGLALRAGWYIWSEDDSSFAVIELGYQLPIIQGLKGPASFSADQPEAIERMWSLHRMSLGFSYGF